MQAALIEFELESATQNVKGFYAGYAATWHYFTREAMCSALSYEDRLWHTKDMEYLPLTFPFDSTPAEPITVKTADVVYKAGDRGDEGLLRFGKQELLLPGSCFRCAIWGEVPELEYGQVFLIGKKRVPARVTRLVVQEVEPNYISEGIPLPIQVSPDQVMTYRAFAPLVGTYRYFILKVPMHSNIRRFSIDNYVVPIPED